uniref:Uncharacterized protein n=1 Tax=Anguilla anguilla TaxID=7936 RepID=A0A0E9S4J2_ANGAN
MLSIKYLSNVLCCRSLCATKSFHRQPNTVLCETTLSIGVKVQSSQPEKQGTEHNVSLIYGAMYQNSLSIKICLSSFVLGYILPLYKKSLSRCFFNSLFCSSP